MATSLLTDFTVFVLALLIGVEVIGKVPATLHTPLMSASNAIHGVVVVGAIIIAAQADTPVEYILLFLAAGFAAMNVVGGFVVTDRMLGMFKAPPKPPSPPTQHPSGNATTTASSVVSAAAGGAHR